MDEEHERWEPGPLDNVSIQKLRIFKVVAELSNFTRAAQYLDISQPVISGHIRKLEEQIEAQLFRRAGRGVALTEVGERVLSWAREVLVESFSLMEDLHKIQTGRMGTTNISSSPSVGSYALGKIVTEFSRQHTDARIHLEIAHPDLSINAVRSGQCDFAVSLLDPSERVDDLNVEVLWYERYMLVCSPESEWAKRKLTVNDLHHIPFITSRSDATRRSIEDDKLLEFGVTKRNIVLEFGHPEPLKRAVLQAAGCAFVFETTVLDELEQGELVEVKVPNLRLRNPILLIARRRKLLSPSHIKLIEYLRTAIVSGTKRPALSSNMRPSAAR